MRRSLPIACALALALTWLGLLSPSRASDDGYKLIVHPGNPALVVERAFLRAAFLKQEVRWPHGAALRPVDVLEPAEVRARFADEVLQRSLAHLRSYWVQRIFSGTGTPPLEVESPAEALSYVLTNAGAVSYVPAGMDVGAAKVLRVH